VAWDVTSGGALNTFDITSEDNDVRCFFIRPDGTQIFVHGAQNGLVKRYTMSTPWDLSTVAYDGASFDSPALVEVLNRGLSFSPDGLLMFLTTDQGGEQMFEYTLSVAWDPSSALLTNTIAFTIPGEDLRGHAWNPAGTRLYTSTQGTGNVNLYDCPTPFDISTIVTAAPTQAYSIAAQTTDPTGMFVDPSELRVYVSADVADAHQYNLILPGGIDRFIDDLGSIRVENGIVDFDLCTVASPDEIADSADLQALLDAGDLTARDALGNTLTDVKSAFITDIQDTGSVLNIANFVKVPEDYDPTITGDFPLSYDSNPIVRGDSFRITAVQQGLNGTGVDVKVGDLLIAIIDTPAQVPANWIVVPVEDDAVRLPLDYDPTGTGDFPITYNSLAIRRGDSFVCTDNLQDISSSGINVQVGDVLIARIDVPAQVPSNWLVIKSEGVFGRQWQRVVKSVTESTTATPPTFTTYETLTTATPLLAGATYRIGVMFNGHVNNNGDDLVWRVRVDGGELNVEPYQVEPQEDTADQRYRSYTIGYFTPGADGVVDIDVDYAEAAGATAFAHETEIEIWRVA
jgi:hypothetical protein